MAVRQHMQEEEPSSLSDGMFPRGAWNSSRAIIAPTFDHADNRSVHSRWTDEKAL